MPTLTRWLRSTALRKRAESRIHVDNIVVLHISQRGSLHSSQPRMVGSSLYCTPVNLAVRARDTKLRDIHNISKTVSQRRSLR